MRIIKEKQNLTYLQWSHIRSSSGTAGSFLKSESILNRKKTYYKLSNFDPLNGVIGHECINELIVDRLLCALGVEHLEYTLINADILLDDKVMQTYLLESEDFKTRGEEKVSLDIFYELGKMEGESPMAFVLRMGWEEYIYQMIAIDYLILNRDRHGANIEVLRNRKTHSYRLAPLFDHGLSLLCSARNDQEALKFDVMEDKPIQSFVGSRSAEANLDLIPKDALPAFNRLEESLKDELFEGLEDVLSIVFRKKIWEMIWKRWCRYEDICNNK